MLAGAALETVAPDLIKERISALIEQGHRSSKAIERIGRQLDHLETRVSTVELRVETLSETIDNVGRALQANSATTERLSAVLEKLDDRIDSMTGAWTGLAVELERLKGSGHRFVLTWLMTAAIAAVTSAGWLATLYSDQLRALFRWVVYFSINGAPP